ncbi:MAG TPA: adenylate/guanylate cyclase domain-containing protein [Anaerolineae bacterium]|nr:adenylate/guanylate cyclase domain-containing protein [Anaerolineae bacterium]
MNVTRTDHAARWITLAAFAGALTAFLVIPILALSWSARPFPGFVVEQTLVVADVDGDGWSGRQAGLNYPQRVTHLAGRAVNTSAEFDAVISNTPPGQSIEVRTVLPDGLARVYPAVALRSLSMRDLARLFWLPYGVGLAYLVIGAWVYRVRGNTRPGRAFAFFSTCAALTSALLFDLSTTHAGSALWTVALAQGGGALIGLALLFPEAWTPVQQRAWLRLWPYGISIALAGWGLLVLNDTANPWAYVLPWRYSYSYAAIALVIFLGMMLYRFRRSPSGVARQQARIVLWGSLLAFTPLGVWLGAPLLGASIPFNFTLFLPGLLIFPSAIAYAIVRYRLLDLDRVLRLGLGYTILSLFVAVGYASIIALLRAVLSTRVSFDDPIVLTIFIVALVIGMDPLRSRVQRVVDRLFFRERADYRSMLEAFSRDLTHTLDLNTILSALDERLNATLHPARLFVFLYDDERQAFVEAGVPPDLAQRFGAESALVGRLQHREDVLAFSPSDSLPYWLGADRQALAALGAVVYVPLRSQERLIGWLALGPKLSGHPYHTDDLAFLAAFANQTAVAVENARLFESVKRSLAAITTMKNLMDNVFASIASGVITTDTLGQVTLFNRAAESILGVSAAHTLGRPFQTALPLRRDLQALIETVREQESILAEEFQDELPQRGPVILSLRLSPLKDDRAGTLGVAMVIDDLTQQRRLEAVREMFRRYVAPAVVDSLPADAAELKLGGQRREVTILYCDLRGFTAFSEQTEPEQLMTILNAYLGLAAECVLAEKGTLDKFMGDAAMAIFNAPLDQPDHTLRAVRAALAVKRAVAMYHRKVGAGWQIAFGIGINTGEAVVGNVGTSQQLTYTSIGDAVNYAWRLQENARAGQILISRAAYERIAQQVRVNELPPLQTKGRRFAEPVYEVVELI